MLVLATLGCCQPWFLPVATADDNVPKKPRLTFIVLGDFTVNLPKDDGALNYMVIGLTIEAAPDAEADLKDMMPRLKESVMRRLMAMAAHGELRPGQVDPLMLKTSLLDGLSKLRPGGVLDVLITRLLYA